MGVYGVRVKEVQTPQLPVDRCSLGGLNLAVTFPRASLWLKLRLSTTPGRGGCTAVHGESCFFFNSGARIQKGRSQPKPALQLAMQRMLQRYSWRSSERALAATRMQH